MATTLVIAGYYGFGNWGDEAALAVLIRYLREALPHARIVVLSHDPAQTARLHGTEAINRWNLFEVHRALARASGFLLGPGGLLQDVTSARSLLYYVGLVRLAQHYHLPTYLIGQGIGPLRSQRSERWVAKALQRARLGLSARPRKLRVGKGPRCSRPARRRSGDALPSPEPHPDPLRLRRGNR
jgi:polysaccharide pyruvyl transferase CsaB